MSYNALLSIGVAFQLQQLFIQHRKLLPIHAKYRKCYFQNIKYTQMCTFILNACYTERKKNLHKEYIAAH